MLNKNYLVTNEYKKTQSLFGQESNTNLQTQNTYRKSGVGDDLVNKGKYCQKITYKKSEK